MRKVQSEYIRSISSIRSVIGFYILDRIEKHPILPTFELHKLNIQNSMDVEMAMLKLQPRPELTIYKISKRTDQQLKILKNTLRHM